MLLPAIWGTSALVMKLLAITVTLYGATENNTEDMAKLRLIVLILKKWSIDRVEICLARLLAKKNCFSINLAKSYSWTLIL